VLGRKNHYGSKSERGTEVSAGMYSLIESAKLVGLNPLVHLAKTVAALLNGEAGLLPHEFEGHAPRRRSSVRARPGPPGGLQPNAT
jgi:hypothetical protein